MKIRTLAIALAACMTTQAAPAGTCQPMQLPMPGMAAQQTALTWNSIDPGVRTYLLLLTANTMELTANISEDPASITPEQQFNLMLDVMNLTPLDSLTGEYLEFVKEANVINRDIVVTLKAEKPTDFRGISAITARFDAELEKLYAKYPTAARYFRKEAQVAISLLMMQEADLMRVAQQAQMAGKSAKEIQKTIVEHLRRLAAEQQ